jgi:hypothetical protein
MRNSNIGTARCDRSGSAVNYEYDGRSVKKLCPGATDLSMFESDKSPQATTCRSPAKEHHEPSTGHHAPCTAIPNAHDRDSSFTIAVVKSTAGVLLLIVLSGAAGCAKKSEPPPPVSVAGEKTYAIRGKIVAKNGGNKIDLDHEAIPGFMEAMEMPYEVRGADVETLPAPGSRIEGKLHVTDDGFWITDVKKAR